jgi:hypothetical protein
MRNKYQFINYIYRSAHLWLLDQRLKHNFWSNCDATVQLHFSILVQKILNLQPPPPPRFIMSPNL